MMQHPDLSTTIPIFCGPSLRAQENSRIWEVIPSPTTLHLTSVHYGNGVWLAFSRGKNEIYRSTDGINWQRLNNVSGFPTPDWQFQARFIDGRFLVRDPDENYTTNRWRQSVDGQVWTDFPVPAGYRVNDIAYANGRWVCVGSPGLFASAEQPGNWTVAGSALTSMSVDLVIYAGERFHAFSRGNSRLDAFSSTDGVEWTLLPSTPSIWFDYLEHGEIERANGSVESVFIGTTNSATYVVGRVSGDRFTWEHRTRTTFGRLIYRRSADATRPGLSRREWVNLGHCCPNRNGPQVYSLRASGETPIMEDRVSLNDFFGMAAGPDAMIGVGTGGLIRRYPTGLAAPALPLDLAIRPAVELKWKSKTGAR